MFLVVVLFVWWAIVTFFPANWQMPLLVLEGVVVIAVIVTKLAPGIANYKF